MPVRENSGSFRQSAALRPLERVETEIVALLRVGARFHQEFYEVCAAEDDGEDESCLPAARSFIYVRAIGQYCGYSLFVAALNGVGQWKGITHRTVPF